MNKFSPPLKVAITLLVLLCHSPAQAASIGPCEGSVLERRLALIAFGKLAKGYEKEHGTLPDLCKTTFVWLQDNTPKLLQGARLCGSSEEGNVYYSCSLGVQGPDSEASDTIETCQLDLSSETLACENRTLITLMPS